jgi:hypothetical protein
LEDVCALCKDTLTDSVTCPICARMLCLDPCFEVHLHARDAFESRDAIDRFLASPNGQPFRDLVDVHIKAHNEKAVDWTHARDCDDCGAFVHETLMYVLVEGVRQACERK